MPIHLPEPVPPQLWDLGGPATPVDVVADARELAVAEQSGVGLADRVRGQRGSLVTVRMTQGTVVGAVTDVFTDAVTIAADQADWLIPLTSVLEVVGPVQVAAPPRGRERGSGLAAARLWTGRVVQVGLSSGATAPAAVLAGVGADHLVFADPAGARVIPWSAVAFVRLPVG